MEENFNKMNKKKERIKLIVLIVSIMTIIGSASYAYFVLGGADSMAKTDVNLGSESSERLLFKEGSPINLLATLDNFAEGDGSLSGETISTATLRASSEFGTATQNYFVYFDVVSNNFIYSVDENTAEVVLTITDPNGNDITSLPNHPELQYVTVDDAVIGEVSGFDVTEFEGLILIDDAFNITTDDITVGVTQEWTAKLTFINLNVAQTENEGKNFDSDLILRSDKQEDFTDYLIELDATDNSFAQHKTSGALDNNYRFSSTASLSNTVKNYICFGSDVSPCPDDNVYRILGVYNKNGDNKVKLIKNTYMLKSGSTENYIRFDDISSSWEGIDTANVTDDAEINLYLNNEFYNNFNVNYRNKISAEKLYLGKITLDEKYRPSTYTSQEKALESVNSYYIGLMNPSDFFYSHNASQWNDYNCYYGSEFCRYSDGSWLSSYVGLALTINPTTADTVITRIQNTHLTSTVANIATSQIFPVFYLKSTILMKSGTGTIADPYYVI